MRKQYKAIVCVFREGTSQTLCADVYTSCGQYKELYKCPESIIDLTRGSAGNLLHITFTANPDLSNIRGVKCIDHLSGEQFDLLRVEYKEGNVVS